MSLDVASCGQVKNGNKICNLLNNLTEKVSNDEEMTENKDKTAKCSKNSLIKKKQNMKKGGTNKTVENETTVPSQINLIESNGDLVHKDTAKQTDDQTKKPKETKKRKKTPNVIDLQTLSSDTKDAKTIMIVGDEPIDRDPKLTSAEETRDIQMLTNVLAHVVTSNRTSNQPYRPMADLLISIGMDAAKIHICKDVVRCFKNKPSLKVSEDVKLGICKAKEAGEYLAKRFMPYSVPCRSCKCGHRCFSGSELAGHKNVGWSTCTGWFRCCFCNSFKTKTATSFVDHLCDEHGVRGTTEPSLKNMCNYCPYENRDWRRAVMHEEKCKSRFVLSRNLSLVHNDILIYGRPHQYLSCFGQQNQPASKMTSFGFGHPQSSTPQNRQVPMVPMSIGRSQPSLPNNSSSTRAIFPKSQSLKNANKSLSLDEHRFQEVAAAVMAQAQMQMNYMMKSPANVVGTRQNDTDARSKFYPAVNGPSCEICDASVMTLESLLKHMQQVHRINIKSIDFFLRGKGYVCQTCFQGFWTHMGLDRHQQQVHNSRPAYPCFICGPITSTDILTHLMTKHNISLQDMLVFGWCYICKAETKTTEKFVDHMVTVHPDLFPSKSALESMVVIFKDLKTNETKSISQTAPGPSKSATSKAVPSATGSRVTITRTKHRCNPCQLKFENEAELKSHRHVFHTVSCTRCEDKYTSVEAMLKHFNQKHYNEKDSCVICKEEVKIGVPMIRHMKRKHLRKCVVMMNRLSPSKRMKYLQKLKRLPGVSSPERTHLSLFRPKVVVQNCDVVSK